MKFFFLIYIWLLTSVFSQNNKKDPDEFFLPTPQPAFKNNETQIYEIYNEIGNDDDAVLAKHLPSTGVTIPSDSESEISPNHSKISARKGVNSRMDVNPSDDPDQMTPISLNETISDTESTNGSYNNALDGSFNNSAERESGQIEISEDSTPINGSATLMPDMENDDSYAINSKENHKIYNEAGFAMNNNERAHQNISNDATPMASTPSTIAPSATIIPATVTAESPTMDLVPSSLQPTPVVNATPQVPIVSHPTNNSISDVENNSLPMQLKKPFTSYDDKMDESSSSSSTAIIVAISIVLIICIVIGAVGYRKLHSAWYRRHYARVDFLIDGMYDADL